jgi:hypothetical protein
MKESGVLLAIVFVLALIALAPLCIIWSVNTLFPALAIPYTWETWIATIVVAGLFKTNVKVNK